MKKQKTTETASRSIKFKSPYYEIGKLKSRLQFYELHVSKQDALIERLKEELRTMAPLNTDLLLATEAKLVETAADLDEVINMNRHMRNVNVDIRARLDGDQVFCQKCCELSTPKYTPYTYYGVRTTPRYFKTLSSEERLNDELDVELAGREIEDSSTTTSWTLS